jgi:hypothetical protein
MNKFVKVCYNSWQCRRSIKVGIGFIIISLVLLAIPLGSLFADTLGVPNSSGSDSNGNWVQYNVGDNQKTTYTWFPDKDCKAKGISFDAGKGNSAKNSFQSGFVGSGVYSNGYFTVSIAADGSSAAVTENDVAGSFMDINSVKIYFECTAAFSAGAGPSRLDWGQNGRDLADLTGCQTGYWHWILTPGGNANILTATLYVTYSDNSQTQTVGGTRSGGANGAFHFDVYNTGSVAVSAYVEYTFSGNMNNPVLTISDSSCSETSTTVGETSSTVGETSSTVGETSSTVGETSSTVGETSSTVGETSSTVAATTSTGTTLVAGVETTTTIGGETTGTTGTINVAGVTDADKGGFIQVAGINELPYTGVNMWFLITGVLFIIAGILSIVIPKYYRRIRYNHQQ